jgi:hypothetical protein
MAWGGNDQEIPVEGNRAVFLDREFDFRARLRIPTMEDAPRPEMPRVLVGVGHIIAVRQEG